jgi:hypothetical protein
VAVEQRIGSMLEEVFAKSFAIANVLASHEHSAAPRVISRSGVTVELKGESRGRLYRIHAREDAKSRRV